SISGQQPSELRKEGSELQKNPQSAIRNPQSIDQTPKSRETSVLLAQAYLQNGKTNEARDIFTKLITNMPNFAQPDDFALIAAKSLDELDVGKENFGKSAPMLVAAEHQRRAFVYQFNRDFPLARLHFKALVEKYPTDEFVPSALYQIGRTFAQEGAFNEAINWFERVQAEFPDEPISKDALSQTASAYSRVNKPKEAISRYQKFIEKYADADNLDRAYLNIIDILRDQGENTTAMKWAAKTQEIFKGKLPEAIALFAMARIRISQNDWKNALADLNALESFSDLGGTRVPGGTNKAEIAFLKGFALENLNRYEEAINTFLSIADGRNEYYGWRATERLKALTNDNKAKSFAAKRLSELTANIEIRNAEAQRKSAQAALRLNNMPEFRARMLEIIKKAYLTLPDYQKIPNVKLLEFGRKEVLKEKSTFSENYHQVLANELLFLGLYDEGTPELEFSRQSAVGSRQNENKGQRTKDEEQSDFNYTLAVYYKRGDMANRAIAFIEPLWKNIPNDYQIELIPREQLEMLYPAPYAESLLKFAPERQIDPRFVLSIMRQESRFRADVKSNAAARGLMQFISTTADKIASELGKENFKQDELYNPPTAILFGSQYLSKLFRQFPNQPPAVAASYNGGEDNMVRWLTRAKSDNPDRYVSEILFAQSKDYVYKVMANYRVYQMLYGEDLKAR
ncbi:MAG: transglycosylase SLT domain-containing protein, partial [Acidobacteria bacterium]|nr:transglycosylase SLT domain-containing protein [Acidobacteriota bacterium]